MVGLQIDMETKSCQCSVKSSLRRAIREITVGVLGLLDCMADKDQRVRDMLLTVLIDSLEEHRSMKFSHKEEK